MSTPGLPANNESMPKHEEWALINHFKAMEYEHLKNMQKITDKEKKKQFK